MSDMAAFHRSIHDNPDEMTTHAVYADLLDDQDHPEAAEIIRRAVAADHAAGGTGVSPGWTGRPGQFRIMALQNSAKGNRPRFSVVLTQRSLAEPSKRLEWLVNEVSPDDTARFVHGIRRGGGMVSPTTDERFPSQPAGGNVDRLARAYQRFARAR